MALMLDRREATCAEVPNQLSHELVQLFRIWLTHCSLLRDCGRCTQGNCRAFSTTYRPNDFSHSSESGRNFGETCLPVGAAEASGELHPRAVVELRSRDRRKALSQLQPQLASMAEHSYSKRCLAEGIVRLDAEC